MPKLKANSVPSYRLHKQSGQAVVTLSGKDHLLGPHGSKESRAKYDRLIAEWLANGRRATYANAEGLTVSRVIIEFWNHAKSYYVTPEGKPNATAEGFRQALIPLRRLYGATVAAEFGPRALKALQQEMIRLGWCRSHINQQIGRLKHVFKWAASAELVPPTVYHGLLTVTGLRYGKTEARESDPVKPVPEEWVRETLHHVSAPVGAMIRLQLASGMRPGEACIMRTGDVETTGNVWTYRPHRHKTQHHGHERVIYLGPQAQEILRPLLKPDLTAYLFSPAEAEADRRAELGASRKTPLSCGNTSGTNRRRRPERAPTDHYTVKSYRQAIARACDAAFPPPDHLARLRVQANGRKTKATRWETVAEWKARLGPEKWDEVRQWREEHRWHPHQLRHAAATRLRKQYGLEAARVVLGHRSAAVAEVYAEIDHTKARQIMGEVG